MPLSQHLEAEASGSVSLRRAWSTYKFQVTGDCTAEQDPASESPEHIYDGLVNLIGFRVPRKDTLMCL